MKACVEGWPNIIESQQFSIESLTEIFALTDSTRALFSHGLGRNVLQGKTVLSLFYQPSTRTRLSFEKAALDLGANVVSTENAKDFSSAIKGEDIEDTTRAVCELGFDLVVMRHYQEGSVAKAAGVAKRYGVPIINAGDGVGQHPTQALLDLYTIYKKRDRIEGLQIAMSGDLMSGRTVHSLTYLLGKFPGVKIYFVSPGTARMIPKITDYLKRHKVPYEECSDLRQVASKVDVIYQTREQTENGTDYRRQCIERNYFVEVTPEVMHLLRQDAVVMHPLPRTTEISREVDSDSRAIYFEQVQNGLHIRRALLKAILAPDA